MIPLFILYVPCVMYRVSCIVCHVPWVMYRGSCIVGHVSCAMYHVPNPKFPHHRRLNICAGTAVRFEPSETKTVSLVPIGGNKIISGGNNLVRQELLDLYDQTATASSLCLPASPAASAFGDGLNIGKPSDGFIQRLAALGFGHEDSGAELTLGKPVTMPRSTYAGTFGPTTGDRVRLGDTDLVIEVEYDLCAGEDGANYGDEVKFGGGKVLRDGLGQASGLSAAEALDTVITNALIVDYTGIYKADVGIKKGNIVGIGKAGNPDTMDNVDPSLYVGVTVRTSKTFCILCKLCQLAD